ncbi:hypothetical protein FRC11_001932, partial [Ceratobasidium sp. 423]
ATNEPEAQPTYSGLQETLTHKFQEIVKNSSMQTLIEVDSTISPDLSYTTQPQEQGVA